MSSTRKSGSRPTGASTGRSAGTVALVGVGPGDPDLLTLRAAELLATADVVVADRAVGAPLLDRCRVDAEIVDVATVAADAIVKTLVTAARDGRRVVRLLPGDPFVEATGALEADGLTEAEVTWQLVPGVSMALSVP